MRSLQDRYSLHYLVSEREEEEVDLSLVLPEPNVSLQFCIRSYSEGERMKGRDQFKCDQCAQLRDATRTSLIKSLPNFLTIHLRRFKYDELRKGIIKLNWLIPFPYKLKVDQNYEKDEARVPPYYKLVGVIAHIGT